MSLLVSIAASLPMSLSASVGVAASPVVNLDLSADTSIDVDASIEGDAAVNLGLRLRVIVGLARVVRREGKWATAGSAGCYRALEGPAEL
jgi:hypothetical protein